MMKRIMPIQNKKKWTKDKPQVPERAVVNYIMYIFSLFGMNTQGGFCDLAILSLKQMANRKFTLSSATKQKLN